MEQTPADRAEPAVSWRQRLASRRPRSAADALQQLALLVLAVSLGLGAVRALQAGWVPVGDEALMEMRVRDVPGHLPLLGVYSRFGWSHPGPAQLWALAVPYRALGSASAGLLVGAMVGHLLVVTASWWIARRVDRLAGAAVLLALELVLLGVPADLVRSAWNPYVALLLAGALVVVAWGTSERQPFPTVLLLPLGTLLVQAHVGNAATVAMVVLVAVALTWWGHGAPRRGPERPGGAEVERTTSRPVPWRAVAWGVGLSALLWVPAAVEQLTGDGNIAAILRDLSREEPRVGAGASIGLSTRFFGVWPAWVDQGSLLVQIAGTGRVWPVWLLVPVAAAIVAWRRGDRTMLRGLALGGAGVASTLVAAAAIKGVFYSYLVVGHRSIVAVLMAISVVALTRALDVPARRVVELGLSGAAVVAALAVGVFQWSAQNPTPAFDDAVREVTAAVRHDAGDRPVFITSSVDDPSRDVASGVLLQLERAGVSATTVRGEDWRMGAHRTSDGDGDATLQVKVVPTGQEQMLLDEGYRILVEHQPLDAADAAEVDRLVAERDAVIREGEVVGPDDPGAAARFATVQELAERIEQLRGDRISTVVGVKG
ncbi:MAG: hypothetical protein ACYC2O_08900 [Microthrixaceae bacterium]